MLIVLVDIGTPPQTVYAQLDTGSFELWVNPNCSTLTSTSDKRFCDAVGSYESGDSSTAEVTDNTAVLRYGIGEAEITYVKDDISISDSARMSGVQFGVATNSTDQFAGILGIGYGEGITTNYKNFVDELADQDVIKTKAFSLALGSKFEQEGVIIFGGVDTSKFTGELASLPIIPADKSPDGVPRYWVEMESISLTPPSGRTMEWANSSMPVFLDSGATLTLLPPDIVQTIAADFGSTSMDASGFYTVDCGIMDMDGTVDFSFDGVTIRVPYKEMIREIRSNPPRCYMGIVPSEEFTLLGDTFLRSAYGKHRVFGTCKKVHANDTTVVFDLDSKVVHMAPYSNCGRNVSRIDSSMDIENLSGDCDRVEQQTAFETPTATTTLARFTATSTPTAAAENPQTSIVSGGDAKIGSNSGSDKEGGEDSQSARVEASWIAIALSIGVSLMAVL